MKIAITGGGTGGHVYPAIAVAIELSERGQDVIWIGETNSFEEKECKKYNISFRSIYAGKLRRYFSLANFVDLFRFIFGFFQSLWLLHKYDIQYIFSKGGYVSFPIILAGKMLGIPILAHESDSVLGISSRVALYLGARLAVVFPEILDTVDIKYRPYILHTGLPIRASILAKKDKQTEAKSILLRDFFSKSKDDRIPILAVICGSQGAVSVNKIIVKNIEKICKIARVIHIVGKGKSITVKLENKIAKNYKQVEYLDEQYDTLVAGADILLMRASSSIWEGAMLGKPMVLVPLPNSASHHQLCNAKIFSKHKASIIVEQTGDRIDDLIPSLLSLLSDKKQMSILGKNARNIYKKNASEMIADEILS